MPRGSRLIYNPSSAAPGFITKKQNARALHALLPEGAMKKSYGEKGLKTLVLERGRMVKHIEDYPTMNLDPWDMEHGGATPHKIKEKYTKQKRWN